ncbi:MAG TPA: OmpA family protein [Kofleriaceae bacterium]|nr:OmpA family protein [Kofleriaceae bacterium]
MRKLVTTLIAGTLAAVGFGSASADDETRVEAHTVSTEVHFDFDSAALSPSAQAELDKAADWLASNPDAVILIEGHADQAGPAPYNKKLAERRAVAARDYLLARGVKAEQVRILSYGEGLPAVDTGKRERLNRRIVLTAIEKEPIIEKTTEIKTEEVQVPVEEKVYVPQVVEREKRVKIEERKPLDVDVLAGGGVTGFIDSDVRDATEVGGQWNARIVGRTHSILGYEAAYIGSAQGINLFGANPDSILMGTGVEGNLRLNFTRSAIQPYIFGGVGLTLYDVSKMDSSMASMEEDDNVYQIPAGAGFRFELPARLVLDVRGTYRVAFHDTMFQGMNNSDNGLDSWAATGQLGMTF